MTEFNFGRLDEPFECDWPVVVNVPQDGGKVSEETFHIRWRLLTKTDTDALTEDPTVVDVLAATLRRAAQGFAAPTTQAFTPEVFTRMLDTPYVRQALNRSYIGFATGSGEKN